MIMSISTKLPQINIDSLNDEISTSDTSSINSTGGHFPFSTYTLDTTLNTILDADNSKYTHIVHTETDAFHIGIGVGYDVNNSGGANHRMQIINITGDLIYEDQLDWFDNPNNQYSGRDCDDYSSSLFTVSCGSVVSTYDEENEMIYFAYLICSTGRDSNWDNRFGSSSNITACTDDGYESEGGILKISSLNTITKTINQIGTITYSNCDQNQWLGYYAKSYPEIRPNTIKLNVNSGSLFMTYLDSVQPQIYTHNFGLNRGNLYCDINLNGAQISTLGGVGNSNHQGTTYTSRPMLQSFQFDVTTTSTTLLRHSTLKSDHPNPALLVGKYAITTVSSSLDCYNLETGSNEKTISRSSSITGYSTDDHQQYYPGNFTLLQSNEGVDLVDSTCSIVKSWDYSNNRGNDNNYLLTWWSNSTSIFVSGYSDSFGGALNYSTNVPSKFFAIFDSNGVELSFVSESDTYWRDQGSRSLPLYKKIAHYGTSKISSNGLTLPDLSLIHI